MSFNFVQSVKDLLSNDLPRLGALTGENSGALQKGIDAAVPLLGLGIFNKAKSPGGASSLFSFFGGSNTGEGLIANLFGSKTEAVTNAVSSYSGLSQSAASSLLTASAPVAVGVVSSYVDNNSLNEADLSNMATSQSDQISSALPASLSSMVSGLGFDSSSAQSFDRHNTHDAHAPADVHSEEIASQSGNKAGWIWPILIILIVGGGILYALTVNSCNNKEDETEATEHATTMSEDSTGTEASASASATTSAPSGKVDTTTGDFIYNTGNIIELKLPNDTILRVGEYSTEAKLVSFLKDGNASVDTAKGNWFEFTNVRFKTASSTLSDSSEMQLKNFVQIAKAFPSATFKIGGYTDNTGDSAANVALSQKRAQAVYVKVLSLGAAKSSLTGAQGYGPQHPLGDNGTPEGKAMNRRVAVNVKSK